ncbi:putative Lipid A export ATP-binding/permease protein MsbA [delta proteobacterium NaphS2]|nr:putative Lipid A export ATP-binding/permease protein MsbA [delta proteobacterium NaphS2]
MLDRILGKEIASYVNRHRGMVVTAVALMIVASLFQVVPVYLLQPFVDEGMKTGAAPVAWKIPWFAFDGNSLFSVKRTDVTVIKDITPNRLLVLLTLVAFVSIFIKSLTTYLAGLAAASFSNKAVKSVRVDLFRKFISLPQSFYHKTKAGELVARSTADLSVLQGLIAEILLGLIEYPLTAFVFLMYLFVMNLKMTLLVFFMVPLIALLIRLFGRKVKKNSTYVQNATADVTSTYHETLLCLKLVHEYFTGKRESERFSDLAENLYKKVMRWNRWHLGLGPLMDTVVFLVMPAILIVGKVYFHHTLGELLAMAYAFSRVYRPIKRLALVNNHIKTLQGATDRVFEIMRTVPEIRDKDGAEVLSRRKGTIAFKNVNFAYAPDEPVLRDVSFTLEAGEMAAFVGSTGAGKSTLLDLIPRFYDVTGGAILIDGHDVRDVTLESLRKRIGIVNQEILLFNETIRYNISYGDPEKSADEVESAARAAYAHDFIMAQPKGYETSIGDMGSLLSGGQRQRIAIARAILVEPAILMLDEAASALDAESEGRVQKAIEGLKGTRTILIVAHRLSTIRKADRIFVLEAGQIVESGSLSELMAKNGRFKQLHDMQFRDS